MILAATIGLGLQLALGWRDAFVFTLLGGFVVAQLVPTGAASCSLRPRPDDAGRNQSG